MTRVYEGPAIRSLYEQLVADFGGNTAVGAYLKISPGTVTKQIHGEAAIGADHFGALEDKLGRWPITDLMANRKGAGDRRSDVHAQAAQAMREAADLGPAIFSLLVDGNPEPLRKEAPELQSALATLLGSIGAAEEPAAAIPLRGKVS